eukprot:4107302-Karenia_brevis.AAC.1
MERFHQWYEDLRMEVASKSKFPDKALQWIHSAPLAVHPKELVDSEGFYSCGHQALSGIDEILEPRDEQVDGCR